MPIKVYYLDDEEMLCENFADHFSTKDVSVTTFIDPKAAIETINKNPPDLLFIDYRLPGTNGDEIAQAIDPQIAKVLITGDIVVNTKYKFTQVFSKPYDEEEIAEFIRKFSSSKKSF